MKRNKKDFFGINVGTVSMVLIFVLLCLVSFAVLCIVSANADKNLSTKIADRTENYYKAWNSDGWFDLSLKTLSIQFTQSQNEDDYFAKSGHDKSFTIPVSDTQSLLVEVEILYPDSVDDTFYRITQWKVLNE